MIRYGTTFVFDTFTDTDGTLLSAHTGELGATWVQHGVSTITIVISDANRARRTSGGASDVALYYASGLPATADYEVSTILRQLTAGAAAGVVGRVVTGATTAYMARYDSAGPEWQLVKYVAGTPTTLGTYAQALAVGQDYRMTLRMRGTRISLLVNNIERIAVTDSAITDAGRAGLRASRTTTNSTDTHYDEFSATDILGDGVGRPGVPAPTGSLFHYEPGMPITEMSGTFTRADATTCATYVDVNGVIQTVAANVLRDEHYVDEHRTTLIEDTRTNLVLHSDALASGWTTGGTPTNAVGTYAGRPFSRFTNPVTHELSRAVTLTGNTVKAFSCLVKADGVNGDTYTGIWDATAEVWRVLIHYTVTGTVVTAVLLHGTSLRVEALADGVYRLSCVSIAAVAANANGVYANGTGGAGLTTVLLSGFQVENAATCSSLIPTGAVTVTRAADVLQLPYYARPQALSFYAAQHVPGGVESVAATNSIWIGDATVGYRLSFSSLQARAQRYGTNSDSGAGPSIVVGDFVEQLGTLSAAGGSTASVSINSAAVVVGSLGATSAFEAEWNTAAVILNGTGQGVMAVRAVKVMAGVQSMETMRALKASLVFVQSLEVAHLLELEFSDGWVRLTTAPQDLAYLGDTWESIGGVLSFGGIEESADVKAHSVDITLSGVDQTVMALLLGSEYRGRQALIYRVYYDRTLGTVLGQPVRLFKGLQLSPYTVQESRTREYGTVTIQTRLLSFLGVERVRGIMASLPSHQHYFAGDLFFQHVASIANSPIYWGIAMPFVPRSGGRLPEGREGYV
jgi:hypothetical protein